MLQRRDFKRRKVSGLRLVCLPASYQNVLFVFNLSQVCFIFWNWNPLRVEETEALKLLKIFPKIKNIKFIGNGFRQFPTVQHWIHLGGLVRRNKREGKLLLEEIDVSAMLWGAYSGLPEVIQHQLEDIQRITCKRVH